jgi:hypothetical protein
LNSGGGKKEGSEDFWNSLEWLSGAEKEGKEPMFLFSM